MGPLIKYMNNEDLKIHSAVQIVAGVQGGIVSGGGLVVYLVHVNLYLNGPGRRYAYLAFC